MPSLSAHGDARRATPDATFAELLMACHGRIRDLVPAFAALAAASPDDDRAVHTAEGLLRYLRIGLPLHAQDEELSLAPRLLALPTGLRLADAIGRMEQEHDAVDAGRRDAIAALVSWLAGRSDSAAGLASAALWLREVLIPHIEAEEADLFPSIAAVQADEQIRMVTELRRRRQG